jgi:hypothetical protein
MEELSTQTTQLDVIIFSIFVALAYITKVLIRDIPEDNDTNYKE